MTPNHRQYIDRYWAAEMAMPPEFCPKAESVYCTVQHLYSGVQLFHRDGWLLIAAPPESLELVASRVRGLPADEVFSVEFVERMLSPDVGTILGPAHVSYADASMFRPSPTAGCRILTPEDAAIHQAFANDLSPVELEQSGFDSRSTPAFGTFVDGELRAVASYEIWKPRIAHITVATHPDYRRRGYGHAAISTLADHAFALGLVLQYRTLAVNRKSQALGSALGFQRYCSTIYAR